MLRAAPLAPTTSRRSRTRGPKNRGYIDGHQRIAFRALYVFPGRNGQRLTATEPEAVRVVADVAAGTLSAQRHTLVDLRPDQVRPARKKEVARAAKAA